MARRIKIRVKHDSCMVSDLVEEEVPPGWDDRTIVQQMDYLAACEHRNIFAHMEATAWLEED